MLSKKELWYICNNVSIACRWVRQVVRCFQKRNFDIFATTFFVFLSIFFKLWDAFKKGTLIYLQQQLLSKSIKILCCEMLSKKELWYICNNTRDGYSIRHKVVRCFQKRNFDIFATTLYFQKNERSCCEMLSKKELWYICNNIFKISFFLFFVVRCFQKRNFDIFATTGVLHTIVKYKLWDAFKKGTLIYLQQLNLYF